MDDSMAILHQAGKPRRNRMHTQQAIQAINEYMNGSNRTSWEFGATGVYVNDNGDLTVTLYSRPIFEIKTKYGDIDRICIHDGGFYDSYGNPSDLTRERLNGLLDALGNAEIIPQNIRVYYDRESSVCYVIRFDEKTIFNKDYCTMVAVKADPRKFIVVDRKLVSSNEKEN